MSPSLRKSSAGNSRRYLATSCLFGADVRGISPKKEYTK
uniref:Uncharacterized protein n=1 Tax=Rhodnius prolixus TaxID=13249 RepID=T1HIZ4_RHOPR